MGAFTGGNYHCKPLMTDVTVIHQVTLMILHTICIFTGQEAHGLPFKD